MARAWTPGQHPTTLVCCTNQRKQPVSSLAFGTSAPTQSGQLTAGHTCPRKVPVVTTLALPPLITPPGFKVPAHSDPVKRWNFCKAGWKCFCLLTGVSVERLPPPDTPDIERAYQDFWVSLLSEAKQCIPPGRRKSYVQCWAKECETLYHRRSQGGKGLWPPKF